MPDDTTLLRWANPIEPATLAALNGRVVALARGLQVTRGRKLRLDGTVVAATIHHPSDSGLLGDGVRVLSRLLGRARAVLGEAAAGLSRGASRTRTRSVRRLARRLHRLARHRGTGAAERMRRIYARPITTARRSRGQAAAVCAAPRARSDATTRPPDGWCGSSRRSCRASSGRSRRRRGG